MKYRPSDLATQVAESLPLLNRRSLPGWFATCALLLAAALLFGFYLVTQQAVASAHVHWEKAPAARLAALDNCVSAPEYSLLHDCRQLR